MRKIVALLFLIAVNWAFCFAQNKKVDSVKTLLQNTKDPLTRLNLLNELAHQYAAISGTTIDPAIYMEMFELGQELGSDSALAISYNWTGIYYYSSKGDNVTALEYYFKALPHAERANDKRRISSLYFDIGVIYFQLEDYETGKIYTLKGRDNLPDTSHRLYDYMLIQYQNNMANYFLLTKQPDSAMYYTYKTIETNKRLNNRNAYILHGNRNLAGAYFLKGDTEKAEYYYQQCFQMLPLINNAGTYPFYKDYIPYLLSQNRLDDAYKQSHIFMEKGILRKSELQQQKAASFLRQIFEIRNNLDSAYFYAKMETRLNEKVSSTANQNKIQTIFLNEQLRRFEEERRQAAYRSQLKQYALIGGLTVFLVIASILYRNNRQKQKANWVLQETLHNLKSTQTQLVQSEKMASLGEMTAGIAHEIQNPLNFVNNFAEVNKELLQEMHREIEAGHLDEAKSLARDVIDNEEKVTFHGKRADAIVKSMLMHSRANSGKKELTDLNALCDEYLRLSYHGLRAKDKSFNADFLLDLDPTLPKFNVVPQDIGRVLLNLINNAFYACNQKALDLANGKEPAASSLFKPEVTVSTKLIGNQIEIRVKDNGNGIPQHILGKIFQPFFTTKPTGQGTGLGLSLSYDIVKAHGGDISIDSVPGKTTFTVTIPLN